MDSARILSPEQLETVVFRLAAAGYTCFGPVRQEDTVALERIEGLSDLACGVTGVQGPGWFRLAPSPLPLVFGLHPGADPWKAVLYPARATVFEAERTPDGLRFERPPASSLSPAFVGMRACDLQALMLMDRILLMGSGRVPEYEALRRRLFVLAVNCTRAADTCFCAATGTGPAVSTGFDICLTELCDAASHRFVAVAGTPVGEAMLAGAGGSKAPASDRRSARVQVKRAAAGMHRRLELAELQRRALRELNHPAWAETAERCLACGNCTLVCPTCLCTSIADVGDLYGLRAGRRRCWDSCFNPDFSYIHGGPVRASTTARYRHFVLHKLVTSVDQYGRPACVGCGRCITGCPAGIDLTATAATVCGGHRSPVPAKEAHHAAGQ